MDERGFIFTTDATLALAIFMVFSASFVTYYGIPGYMGADHEHLERISADALRIMHQDGTLYRAAVEFQNGNVTGAQDILNSALLLLIPSNTGYEITLARSPSLTVRNDRNISHATNVATRTKVISAPREGWMGRAWYKVEKAEFVNQRTNVTTTLWNFHNWLTNFPPWNNRGLRSHPSWGRAGNRTVNINFSLPAGSTLHNAFYLIGSSANRNGSSFASNVVINGDTHFNSSRPVFLNNRPGITPPARMHNYQRSGLRINPGMNSFHVNFLNMTTDPLRVYNMPWFSIIANYETRFRVPEGVLNRRFNFTDAAGLAVPTAQDLDGVGGANDFGRIYDLRTGTVSSFSTPGRTMNWNTFAANRNTLDAFDDGIPFVITHLPNIIGTRHGSAVSVIQEFNIPDNVRILDAFTVLNAYGAVDNAMVEVCNGTHWRTVFCSFDFDGVDYTGRDTIDTWGQGYGNIPGILYIGNRLRAGRNRVRITIWDIVPANDYDLVGLVDSYTHLTYTGLPIRWENFPFRSFQSNTHTNQLTHTFTTEANAREVYLFLGTGLDSRHLRVEVAAPTGNVWRELYSSNVIPFYLNLASLDAGRYRVFTNGTAGNYTITPGVNYRVRVTVTGPAHAWESGGPNREAEIYSGTRVSVLYPEFLENRWALAHSNDPRAAKQLARERLEDTLRQHGITPKPDLIRTEALFTGELPYSIPVRLELWRH